MMDLQQINAFLQEYLESRSPIKSWEVCSSWSIDQWGVLIEKYMTIPQESGPKVYFLKVEGRWECEVFMQEPTFDQVLELYDEDHPDPLASQLDFRVIETSELTHQLLSHMRKLFGEDIFIEAYAENQVEVFFWDVTSIIGYSQLPRFCLMLDISTNGMFTKDMQLLQESLPKEWYTEGPPSMQDDVEKFRSMQ